MKTIHINRIQQNSCYEQELCIT